MNVSANISKIRHLCETVIRQCDEIIENGGEDERSTVYEKMSMLLRFVTRLMGYSYYIWNESECSRNMCVLEELRLSLEAQQQKLRSKSKV